MDRQSDLYVPLLICFKSDVNITHRQLLKLQGIGKQKNSEYCGPSPGNNFDIEVGQRSRSRHGAFKGLVTRIMHAKYQCSVINTSEDLSFHERWGSIICLSNALN